MKKLIFFLVVATIATVNVFGQAIPKQISYQGVLKDASGLVNGDQALTFKIYNEPTGGTPLWTEIQVITVTDGLFNAFLGSSTPITGVPFDRIHFLGIQVGTGSELTPRTMLTPTPYSFMAIDIMDNTVTTNKIVDATITGTDIANNTIGPEKLNFTPGSGTIGGSGTANYIPRFTAATTLGNSIIYQDNYSIKFEAADLILNYPPRGNGGRAFVHHGTNSNDDLLAINFNGDFEKGVSIMGPVGFGLGSQTSPGYPLHIINPVAAHVVHSEYTGTTAYDGVAVYGKSVPFDFYGIGGYFQGGYHGVYGEVLPTGSQVYYGVRGSVSGGTSPAGSRYGVYGIAVGTGTGTRYGIYGNAGGGTTNWAGYFSGNMRVTGIINPAGMQSMIDHPLDPANKYLYHAVVESPDMKNIYDGNVVTDGSGYATVTLPDWFEALNKELRYQLTVIGDFAQAIIAQEVQRNQFLIRTDKPNIKVSWQVTGIRKDAFAEKNRKPVEELKQGDEVGKYIHPNAFELPETMAIDYEKNNPER